MSHFYESNTQKANMAGRPVRLVHYKKNIASQRCFSASFLKVEGSFAFFTALNLIWYGKVYRGK